MKSGRRIAFDYGDTRIGVALSDLHAILASPLTVLLREDPALSDQLAALFLEHEPIAIYLGNPLHLSGLAGASSSKVSDFKALLESITAIPVTLIDERMSTASGLKSLREAGVDSRKAKELIDAVAAVAILEQGIAMEQK
jgi:putative Holliday junction resolvase